MLDTGEWWMLKEQYEEGKTITALAKETGHDRKTVRKYLRAGDKPTYKPRESKPGLLDPFQDFIKKRVVKDGIMASRILREIRNKGYTGGYTILKEYIRPLRVEQSIEAIYRYETKPGVQSQVDFDPVAYTEMVSMAVEKYIVMADEKCRARPYGIPVGLGHANRGGLVRHERKGKTWDKHQPSGKGKEPELEDRQEIHVEPDPSALQTTGARALPARSVQGLYQGPA
jgi:hypothetical protein